MLEFNLSRHNLKPMKQQGFTLIEALVALLILTLTLSSIWSWLSSARNNMESLELNAQLPFVAAQFEQHLSTHQIPESNSGDFTIGQFQVRYTAKLERSNTSDAFRRQYAWIVELYNIEARVYHQNTAIDTWITKKVQYRQDPNYVPIFQ